MAKKTIARKKSSVKDRVLRMARNKFLSHGFYNISMDSLVKDLQTSKSSLYNHFESKEVLVEQLLILLNREINQKLKDILKDDKLTFKGKLIAVTAFTTQVLTEVSEAFLSDLEIHTPVLWEKYQAMRKERINNYYKSLFRTGIKEGVVRSDINLDLVMTVYLSLTEIPLRFKHVSQLGLSHEKIYEDVTEIFLNGMRAPA